MRYSVPSEVAGHKSPTTKGDRGMNSAESSFISIRVGELHPQAVGTRKLHLKVNAIRTYC